VSVCLCINNTHPCIYIHTCIQIQSMDRDIHFMIVAAARAHTQRIYVYTYIRAYKQRGRIPGVYTYIRIYAHTRVYDQDLPSSLSAAARAHTQRRTLGRRDSTHRAVAAAGGGRRRCEMMPAPGSASGLMNALHVHTYIRVYMRIHVYTRIYALSRLMNSLHRTAHAPL